MSIQDSNFQGRVLSELAAIRREVVGEGDYPGLRGRVQRVEDLQAHDRWWQRTTIAAAIGAALSGLAAWFHK